MLTYINVLVQTHSTSIRSNQPHCNLCVVCSHWYSFVKKHNIKLNEIVQATNRKQEGWNPVPHDRRSFNCGVVYGVL